MLFNQLWQMISNWLQANSKRLELVTGSGIVAFIKEHKQIDASEAVENLNLSRDHVMVILQEMTRKKTIKK